MHRPTNLVRLAIQHRQLDQSKHYQHSPDFAPILIPSATALNGWRRDIVKQEGRKKFYQGIRDMPAPKTIILSHL